MDLMNEKEYTQACLFRIREALATAKAWWETNASLDRYKIRKTIDMLQDTIDELQYFQSKLDEKTNVAENDYEPAGLYKR